MERLPTLPQGRKCNIAWTSNGRRLMGTCWTKQLRSFLDTRVLLGSADIRVVCNGKTYDLGDKCKL